MAKGKKKKLGGNRIDEKIDFNTLVTDDLKLKEVTKKQDNPQIVKKVIKTGLVETPKQETIIESITQNTPVDIKTLGTKTGYGSDDLYPEEILKVNIGNYQVGNAFGSDQMETS